MEKKRWVANVWPWSKGGAYGCVHASVLPHLCSDWEKPFRRKVTMSCFGKTNNVSLGPIPKGDLSFTYVAGCIRWKGLLNFFFK